MPAAKLEAQALQPGVPQITPPSLVDEAQIGALGNALDDVSTAVYRAERGSTRDDTGERMATAASLMATNAQPLDVDQDTFLELTAEFGSEKLAEMGLQIKKDAGGRYQRFNEAAGQSRTSFVNSLRRNLEMVELIKANPYYAPEIRQAFSAEGTPTREDLENVMGKISVDRAVAAETARNNFISDVVQTYGVELGSESFDRYASLHALNKRNNLELEAMKSSFGLEEVTPGGPSLAEVKLDQDKLNTLYQYNVGTSVSSAVSSFLGKLSKQGNISLTEYRDAVAQFRQTLASKLASDYSQDGPSVEANIKALTSILDRLDDKQSGKETLDMAKLEAARLSIVKDGNDIILERAKGRLIRIPGGADAYAILEFMKNADPIMQDRMLQNLRVGNQEVNFFEILGQAMGSFLSGQEYKGTGASGNDWTKIREIYQNLGKGAELPQAVALSDGRTVTGTNELAMGIINAAGADAQTLKTDQNFLNNLVRIFAEPGMANQVIEATNRLDGRAAKATLEALNNHFTALTNDMVAQGAGEFGFFQAGKRSGMNTFFKPVIDKDGNFSFTFQALAGGVPPGFQEKLERLNKVIAPQLNRAAKAFAHTIMDSTNYEAAAYELINRGGFRLDTAGNESSMNATLDFEVEKTYEEWEADNPTAGPKEKYEARKIVEDSYDRLRPGNNANTKAGS